MIQRIQSLYLLAISALSIVVIFSPLIIFADESTQFVFSIKEVTSLVTIALTVVSVLIPIISLITIFLYKNRSLQIKLSIINIVLMMVFYVLLALCIKIAVDSGLVYQLQFAVILPAIAIILSFLALRAIKKDEALIKSLHRMR